MNIEDLAKRVSDLEESQERMLDIIDSLNGSVEKLICIIERTL
jgi:hypothetical protein